MKSIHASRKMVAPLMDKNGIYIENTNTLTVLSRSIKTKNFAHRKYFIIGFIHLCFRTVIVPGS